ncbi:MAG: PAS domain S-box protein [Chlamydiia bacterium]|nr:PAS domain S-box protein [Chlamydiia bacterium]
MKARPLSKKKTEALYRSYIETMEDWLWECDLKGNILFSSPSVEKLLGYSEDEILGINVFSLLNPDDHEMILLRFGTKHLGKKANIPLTTRFYTKKGGEMWFDSKVTALSDSHGEQKGFRVLSRDLSEMKRLEALRLEVTSVISHEIRTPLTAIHGALTLLTTESMRPKEAKSFIQVAYKNSLRLKDLVENLLDIKDSKEGVLKYDMEILEVKALIKDFMKGFSIKTHPIKLKLNRGPAPHIRGDKERLTIVLSNLVKNAMKASDEGKEITITIKTGKGWVRVLVKDKGKGIPKEFHPIIFDSFVQAESVHTRKHEGAGLGLTLCRQIIEGHGGQIDFVTEEGKGSTFYFQLPTVKRNP